MAEGAAVQVGQGFVGGMEFEICQVFCRSLDHDGSWSRDELK